MPRKNIGKKNLAAIWHITFTGRRSMKATETFLILCQMDAGEITLQEAHKRILRLFGVMESDCDHEWINHSFDHFGFLQEQICDKCGAKQSVP